MSIMILDDTISGDRLENIEDILEAAWDRESPSLIKNYGLPALQAAQYRLRLEVIIDDTD